MIGYRYLPPAEDELIEAGRFYEAAAAGLGHDFLAEVQRAIDILRDHPKLGRAIGSGLRRAVLRRFPYSLVYALEPDAILIVAVAHHKRRPDYWRTRLDRPG